MTPTTRSLIPIIALLLSIVGTFGAPADETNREADHAALRALRDKLAAAINTQDVKTLGTCFAKEFAFTAVNQCTVTNEAQMQDFLDRMFRSKDAPIASLKSEPKADILTRFIDANTGVCYGSSRDTYTLKTGEVVEMDVRWSATVVKESDGWKVAIAHVGTDFLNNPVLEFAKGFARKVGIGAGVGGLVAGLVVGIMLGRKKQASAQKI